MRRKSYQFYPYQGKKLKCYNKQKEKLDILIYIFSYVGDKESPDNSDNDSSEETPPFKSGQSSRKKEKWIANEKGPSWTKKKKQKRNELYPRRGNYYKKCVARNKKRYFCRFKCNVNTCNSNTNSNKEECQKFSAFGALKYLNNRNVPLSWAKFRCGKCEPESAGPPTLPPTPPPDCVIWGGCGGGGGDLW